MMVLALLLITLLSSGALGSPRSSSDQESVVVGILQADLFEWLLRSGMFFLGFSAGIFVIPLQVYIQKTPPPEQKGRVIGAPNLLSWMGISASAVFVGLSNKVTDELAGDGLHIV